MILATMSIYINQYGHYWQVNLFCFLLLKPSKLMLHSAPSFAVRDAGGGQGSQHPLQVSLGAWDKSNLAWIRAAWHERVCKCDPALKKNPNHIGEKINMLICWSDIYLLLSSWPLWGYQRTFSDCKVQTLLVYIPRWTFSMLHWQHL